MLASGLYGIVSVDVSKSSRRLVNRCAAVGGEFRAAEGGEFVLGSSFSSSFGGLCTSVSFGLTSAGGSDLALTMAGGY